MVTFLSKMTRYMCDCACVCVLGRYSVNQGRICWGTNPIGTQMIKRERERKRKRKRKEEGEREARNVSSCSTMGFYGFLRKTLRITRHMTKHYPWTWLCFN